MITLTQLKYIVSLAKEKHFGRAAKECNVSQPSLSTQIQKVEEGLGAILFDRSKKPVMLTKEGFDFVEKAKQILASVQSLEHSAKNSDEVSGEFLLGVIPTLAPYIYLIEYISSGQYLYRLCGNNVGDLIGNHYRMTEISVDSEKYDDRALAEYLEAIKNAC